MGPLNGSNDIVQSRTSTDSGATWSGPVDLSAAGRTASVPQVASSADGTKLTAVWIRSNGTFNIAQSRTSTDGGVTWDPAVDLSDATHSANYPHVASSADGNTLAVVWNTYRGGSSRVVQSATSTNGGATWSAPADLSTEGYWSTEAQLAVSADGTTATAVWSLNKTDYIVQSATSTDSGATWGDPVDLSAAGYSAYVSRVVFGITVGPRSGFAGFHPDQTTSDGQQSDLADALPGSTGGQRPAVPRARSGVQRRQWLKVQSCEQCCHRCQMGKGRPTSVGPMQSTSKDRPRWNDWRLFPQIARFGKLGQRG